MSKKEGSTSKGQSKLSSLFGWATKPCSPNMSTDSSSKAPPKGREEGGGRITRARLGDEERKEVEEEREISIRRSLKEKRERYKCKNRYQQLNDVETWKKHANQNESSAATVAKKKKSAETKEYEVRDELNVKVSLWRGDITTLEIDAIVNAANESLLGGGGVDGAIHSAAGPKLKKECAVMYNGCGTGEAKITAGYDLPAKYVIHTVGPIGEQEQLLRSCYIESLERMKENELRSIAFPCISTGIYGYPNSKAAPVAMKTVREWLENDDYGSQVERVIFCLFLKVDVELYEEGMKTFFPLGDEKTSNSGAGSKDKNGSDSKEGRMEIDEEEEESKKKSKSKSDNENEVEMRDSDLSGKEEDNQSGSRKSLAKGKASKKNEKGGNSKSVKASKSADDDKKTGKDSSHL